MQETISSLRKTPLYDRHVALGGKIVGFGGWALPVYYTSIVAEHQAVRKACGLFDVSHLGEIRVYGPGAFAFLQYRLTNDLRKVKPGRMLYSLVCDERGMALDDILVYQNAAEDYHLVVNASNIEKGLEALTRYASDSVRVENLSDSTACIAAQGPHSEEILGKLLGIDLSRLGYYSFCEQSWKGQALWISRSGYTGEDGFEIFSLPQTVVSLWDLLAEGGKKLGAVPAGLGARNTLRLEAGNILYGHELTPDISPLEAGVSFAISFDKGAFVGRDGLLIQKQSGIRRKIVGFKMLGQAVAREQYPVYREGKRVGSVTSGSYAPTVAGNVGMALVERGCESPGVILEIEVHGRRVKAETVPLPFVAWNHKRQTHS